LCATSAASWWFIFENAETWQPPSIKPRIYFVKNYLYFVIHGIVKLCLILNVLLH